MEKGGWKSNGVLSGLSRPAALRGTLPDAETGLKPAARSKTKPKYGGLPGPRLAPRPAFFEVRRKPQNLRVRRAILVARRAMPPAKIVRPTKRTKCRAGRTRAARTAP